MTFPECVLYQKAIQMFKTIRGNAPEYLRKSFTFVTDIHARLLRSSSIFQLYTQKPRLEIYRNTFIFSGSSVWISLPSCNQNSNSVQHFKSQYFLKSQTITYTCYTIPLTARIQFLYTLNLWQFYDTVIDMCLLCSIVNVYVYM